MPITEETCTGSRLHFNTEDGVDPYAEDSSTVSSKLEKWYWMLRKNPDTPMCFGGLLRSTIAKAVANSDQLFRMIPAHFNGICLIENHHILLGQFILVTISSTISNRPLKVEC